MSKRIVMSIFASIALSLGGWLSSCGSIDHTSKSDVAKLEQKLGLELDPALLDNK